LNGSLILGAYRPSGGWRAQFQINGVNHLIDGRTAHEVALRTSQAHAKNGISLTAADIWLNLNLQWMDRLDAKRFTATQAALTEMIVTEGTEAPTKRRVFPPEVWGSIAWKWLGLFLAKDDYLPDLFLHELERVLSMLDPALCPTLGCLTCFVEFSAELNRIRLNMPETKEDARRWLHSFHNRVNARIGKSQLSFASAAEVNFWT